MVEIPKSDIIGEPAFPPILSRGLHGGIMKSRDLPHDLETYCERKSWIDQRVSFQCHLCGMTHEVSPTEIHCSSYQTKLDIENSNLTRGYAINADAELPPPPKGGYRFEMLENSKYIQPRNIDEQSIYFLPKIESVQLYDEAGRIVMAPIQKLVDVYSPTKYDELIEEIHDLVTPAISWEKLDDAGSDFQDITYRLLSLEDGFDNITPGGSGPDQGKDGFCYRKIGRRETKIMVQVKFNNRSSGVNAKDIISMSENAKALDCKGLLLTTINTTGDLETKLATDDFLSSLYFLDVWNGERMKSKLAKYPDLIDDYFLN